ncbi:hypothetical protein BJH90_11330 [Bacillus halotolerans]|nr:hypothetical protein BJH90_11330 [Bacillus halotolerans]
MLAQSNKSRQLFEMMETLYTGGFHEESPIIFVSTLSLYNIECFLFLSSCGDVLECVNMRSNICSVNGIKALRIIPPKQTVNKVPMPIGPFKIIAAIKKKR